MATCKALFISIQDLEINCNLSESVESNTVDSVTQTQQLKYIKPLLGKELYNELIDQVENATLTTLNTDLIDQIKPALSWLVYNDLVPFINVQSSASGMVKSTGDTFTLADKEELASISKKAYGNWQVYEKELLEFLEDNKTDYPLYEQHCKKYGITGYSISAIGGKQNKVRYYNVHYPSRFGK